MLVPLLVLLLLVGGVGGVVDGGGGAGGVVGEGSGAGGVHASASHICTVPCDHEQHPGIDAVFVTTQSPSECRSLHLNCSSSTTTTTRTYITK